MLNPRDIMDNYGFEEDMWLEVQRRCERANALGCSYELMGFIEGLEKKIHAIQHSAHVHNPTSSSQARIVAGEYADHIGTVTGFSAKRGEYLHYHVHLDDGRQVEVESPLAQIIR